jgi:hypothetical protein
VRVRAYENHTRVTASGDVEFRVGAIDADPTGGTDVRHQRCASAREVEHRGARSIDRRSEPLVRVRRSGSACSEHGLGDPGAAIMELFDVLVPGDPVGATHQVRSST